VWHEIHSIHPLRSIEFMRDEHVSTDLMAVTAGRVGDLASRFLIGWSPRSPGTMASRRCERRAHARASHSVVAFMGSPQSATVANHADDAIYDSPAVDAVSLRSSCRLLVT
jgi:hypothetical protein